MLSLKAEEEKPAHWSSSLSCSLSDRITKDTDRHLSLPASLPFLRWADMKRTHYRGVTAGEQITDARVWSPLPGASCSSFPLPSHHAGVTSSEKACRPAELQAIPLFQVSLSPSLSLQLLKWICLLFQWPNDSSSSWAPSPAQSVLRQAEQTLSSFVAPGVRAESSKPLMIAPGSTSWGPCVLRSDCGAE